MKTIKLLFAACFAVLCLQSCEKEEVSTIASEAIDIEQIKNQYPKTSSKNIVVERVTLEELNRVLIENGIEPYTEKAVSQLYDKYLKSGLNCSSLKDHADWNGNGTVSTIDVVLARNYIIANDPNGQAIDPTTSSPTYVIDFGFLTAIYNGTEPWRLDQDDLDVGVITILYC